MFRSRNRDDPGLWSLAQSGAGFVVPSDEGGSTRSLEIELYNALPSPRSDVSLDDVLVFKTRREAELAALRAAMDQLYLDVAGAPDVPRAKTAALDKLSRAISDLDRAAAETWPHRLATSVKIELSAEALINALIGAAAAMSSNVPVHLGAALGSLGSVVKFSVTPKGVRKLPPDARDFAYVLSAKRDLG